MKWLKTIRQRQKKSLADIADILGVSRTRVWHAEVGRGSINPEQVVDLSIALNLAEQIQSNLAMECIKSRPHIPVEKTTSLDYFRFMFSLATFKKRGGNIHAIKWNTMREMIEQAIK